MSASKDLVEQRLATIKQHMPNVLACIEDRAQYFGPEAYKLVRRGLRGEPGCFYAIEGGHVVGNPMGLDRKEMGELANHMVIFGCAHVCIWPLRVWQGKEGAADGAH